MRFTPTISVFTTSPTIASTPESDDPHVRAFLRYALLQRRAPDHYRVARQHGTHPARFLHAGTSERTERDRYPSTTSG